MGKLLFEATENTAIYGGVFSDETLDMIEIYTDGLNRHTLYEYYYSTVILFLNQSKKGCLYIQAPVNEDNDDILNIKIIRIYNYNDCLEVIKECGYEEELMYSSHYKYDDDEQYREDYEEYIKSLFI